ncbi:HAD family hydrolase [Gayadomonas joobiniege]|uniref:HAD family hydrolase n=1 Tax=Gayadomonas joobiniege TaxID=1234606 RepID=UPI00035E1E0A|nr:HAD family phosphatase [Gayadomonas joobiniege]
MVFSTLFIDHDGTLVDSEPAQHKIWQQVLAPFSISLSFADFKPRIGLSGESTATFFVNKFNLPISSAELSQLKVDATLTYIHTVGFTLMPAVEQFLTRFKKFQPEAKIALVSGSDRSHVIASLAHHPQLPIDLVVAGGDTKNTKPNPEPYLKAISDLQVLAEHVLVLEDSESGIQAATAAGLTTYALAHAYSDKSSLQKADKIFHHFDELNAHFFG